MKKILLFIIAATIPVQTALALPISVDKDSNSTEEVVVTYLETKEEEKHNWRKTSSEVRVVEGDSHEYTVRHNFVKRKRTCDITHKIKTDVWYCDIHDHTKSKISLEETIHSRKHSH